MEEIKVLAIRTARVSTSQEELLLAIGTGQTELLAKKTGFTGIHTGWGEEKDLRWQMLDEL